MIWRPWTVTELDLLLFSQWDVLRPGDSQLLESHLCQELPRQIQTGSKYRDDILHQTIIGNLWCPWQENLLFSVDKSELYLVDAVRYFCLI